MLPETHPETYRKHEMVRARHPFYACWYNMYQRCMNTNHASYSLYGGRGIWIDPDWEDFEHFFNDMFDTWQKGLELDRIDNDQGYCKANCRWITRKEQCRNTSSTKLSLEDVEIIRGLRYKKTNKAVGEMFGISASHVCRIQSGEKWS